VTLRGSRRGRTETRRRLHRGRRRTRTCTDFLFRARVLCPAGREGSACRHDQRPSRSSSTAEVEAAPRATSRRPSAARRARRGASSASSRDRARSSSRAARSHPAPSSIRGSARPASLRRDASPGASLSYSFSAARASAVGAPARSTLRFPLAGVRRAGARCSAAQRSPAFQSSPREESTRIRDPSRDSWSRRSRRCSRSRDAAVG
jgi:hypothetical protein